MIIQALKRRVKSLAMILCMLCICTDVQAEIYAVVVGANNNTDLSTSSVRHIYLGRPILNSNGKRFSALISSQSSKAHQEFASSVLNRSASQLNSFWAKLLFTGKGEIPKRVKAVEELKRLIAENTNYIGYIPVSDVDSSLRIVLQYGS